MSRTLSLLCSVADGTVRRCIVGALLAVIACAALAGTAPVLLKLSIDRLAASSVDAAYLVPIIFIALYAGVLWLVRILQELRVLLYGRADQRIQRSISIHLLTHTLSLPVRYHLNREVGALVLTLNNGLLGCRIVTQHLVLSILPVLLEIGTITAVLMALNQKLFLLVIYGMFLCYGAILFIGMNRLGKAARAATSSQVQAGGLLTDTILNYEAIKVYGADRLVLKRFGTALAVTENQWGAFYSKKLRFGFVAATVFAIGLCLSLSLAARKVADGALSIGEFVLVQTYVLQLVMSFELFGYAMRDTSQGIAYLEQLQELLAEHPEDGPSAALHREINSTSTGELTFDAVSFSHDERVSVLSNISFSIPPGSTIAVVGPTGSGKSSLLRLILRFHEPSSGRILLDKVPISDIPLPTLRGWIALVPQDIALFNESIAFNVGIGGPDSTPEQIREAAEAALVRDFCSAQRSGFDAKIGERGSKVSGGERQRIAIARALLKRPRILLLDEATSALDPATERRIWQNIRAILCGSTSLIVAHRLATVVDADEILVLDSGRIVERGTHSALVHAGGTYASMWHAQERQANL